MIRKDNEFQFAAVMRQRIFDILAGIENATWDRFNDRSPNWLTRSRLETLINEYAKGLISLGAIPATAHAPCGHPDHGQRASWKLGSSAGHWRYVLADGRTDSDLLVGDQMRIDGQVMESDFDSMVADQIASHDPCPCAPGKRAHEHSVSSFYIWPRDAESHLAELAQLTLHLTEAVQLSEDRRPRAAIREELLRAFITLERLLVPVTAEEEIARREVQ